MPRKYEPKTDRKNAKHKAQTMESVKFQPGFMETLDGRTAVAKALEQSYNAICADLGSEANLSYLQLSLVERAVFLEGVLRDIEHQLAMARQAGPGDKEAARLATDLIGKWVQSLNAYSGLCAKLGLERRATSKPWMVTNDNGGDNGQD